MADDCVVEPIRDTGIYREPGRLQINIYGWRLVLSGPRRREKTNGRWRTAWLAVRPMDRSKARVVGFSVAVDHLFCCVYLMRPIEWHSHGCPPPPYASVVGG